MSERQLAVAVAVVLAACQGSTIDPPRTTPAPVAVGETREVELRDLRFDVSNYAQTLGKADLLRLPLDVRRRLWLLDLDISNGPSSPRLLENALTAMRTIDPATLDAPSQNLQRLLNMTADTADLRGTKLEAMLNLAPLVGVAPGAELARMLGKHVDDTLVAPSVLAQTLLELVIDSHPNARTRLGPITATHPDGVYAVAPGALPVTLEDMLTDGATLAQRFGPVWQDGVYHPGFIGGSTKLKALKTCANPDDPNDPNCFRITVRVNGNALPYKGIDLTNASIASVNSIPSQVKNLFDFADPNWLTMQGIEDAPSVETLTFTAREADGFIPGGTLPVPAGIGNSPGWELPPWTLERVLLAAAARSFADANYDKSYYSASDPNTPLLTARVTNGWQEITTKAGLGTPPAPSYLWDVLLEAGQVRLHDGVPEGQANVAFALHNIPLGVDRATIESTVRANLEATPESFLDVAKQVIDTSSGAADFYYLLADAGDELVFIAASDIRTTASGAPERPYAYAHPGFYADQALSRKLSSPDPPAGDGEHETVAIKAGDTLYAEDDQGLVYRVAVGPKPAERRCHLSITRVK
jgi:hypothetical protein